MILAPLTELPKEEEVAARGNAPNWPLDSEEQARTLAAINAHRAKLDKVVSEAVAEFPSHDSHCICLGCTIIRHLKETDNA